MKIELFLIFLSLLSTLVSCQVKEADGSLGFVAGHAPVTNNFSLTEPVSATLVHGDMLILTLSFPYPVTVTGTPSLGLIVGSTAKQATYSSGSGTKFLTFSYEITAADEDNNGVAFTGINLNGGSLTFQTNGRTINCSTALAARTFEDLLVDNSGPTVSAGVFLVAPAYYRVGDSISLRLSFSEKVYVTGTPRLRMQIDAGGPVYANYVGGSGSKDLSFAYSVASTAVEKSGTIGFDATIDLNGGTITDFAGNAASVSLGSVEGSLETLSNAVKFNGKMPVDDVLIVPTPRTYAAAESLEFVLEFDRPVTVNPGTDLSLPIMMGPNASPTTKKASYVAASSTSTALVFTYTIVPGDHDTDGIQTGAALTMSGATITAQTGGESFVNEVTIAGTTYQNHKLNIPNVSNIKISAIQPAIQSVTIAPDVSGAYGVGTASDNYFKSGENMLITLNFNDGMFVNQTGGTPRIPITVGATTRYANYLSGGDGQTSLIFKYTVQDGDEDTNGIDLAANLDMNGGTITNAANTNTSLPIPTTNFPTRMVDGVRPTISTVAPNDGVYSAQAGFNQMNFTVNWNEAVRIANTVNLPVIINATTRNATFISGTDVSATVFRYTITTSDTSDFDGVTLVSPVAITTGTIYDSHGNAPASPIAYPLPDTTNVIVDRTPPTVIAVTSPAAGRYYTGQALDFTFDFSEPVTVGTAGGIPYIQLRIGSNTRRAYVSTSGTSASHTFRYTVATNDTDPDFVAYFSTSITVPTNSYIKDEVDNVMTAFTFSDPTWTGVIIDEVEPTVSSASTTAGTYVAPGEGTSVITVSINMSEAVTVLGGTPSISLRMETGDVVAEYDPVTSTATSLKFTYTIDGTVDMDVGGLALAAATMSLNGATMKDALDNDAVLNIGTVSNLTNVKVVPHAVVWMKGSTTNRSGFTTKPTISTNASLVSGYYQFNGIDRVMSFSSLPAVEALYMAIRTPVALDTFPQELVSAASATLTNADIDMETADAPDVRSSTSGYAGSGLTHDDAFAPNTLQQVEFIYSSGAATLPASPFIPAEYTGRVVEILIFDTALSADQKNAVYDYLNSTY